MVVIEELACAVHFFLSNLSVTKEVKSMFGSISENSFYFVEKNKKQHEGTLGNVFILVNINVQNQGSEVFRKFLFILNIWFLKYNRK